MLTHWRPFNELSRYGWDFDDLFHRGNSGTQGFSPAVDIEEEKTRFIIKADLPGVNEKEIDVKVHDGKLLLSGVRTDTKEEKNEHGYYRERSQGSFCRQFDLGPKIDSAKIEASYKNGVLMVVLPKKEEAQPKQITVSTN